MTTSDSTSPAWSPVDETAREMYAAAIADGMSEPQAHLASVLLARVQVAVLDALGVGR